MKKKKNIRLSNIEFMWIRRDEAGKPGSFGWMTEILNNLEQDPAARNFLRVHNFLTGGSGGASVRPTTSTLETPASVFRPPYAPSTRPEDSVLKSRHRTHYGRPNWDEIFHELATIYPSDEVGLFICGPRPLCQFLKEACAVQTKKAQKRQLKTKFVFHKENF